jgi:hypothetical protein
MREDRGRIYIACDGGTAGVAELADALDSKSSDRKIVWVRAPPPANSLKRFLPRKVMPRYTLDFESSAPWRRREQSASVCRSNPNIGP